jgi:sigma-B regulation protein RsbU (phosphoserine phosphatase)
MPAELHHFKIRVFLVDDQAIVGEQVRRMLADQEDIEFAYCADPAKAVTEAAAFKPTVILQDLVMPDIDGMTLVRFYRGHSALKEVPLIVLSTREEAKTKADAFSAGANDYLVKLPDKLELVARIRYHSWAYINLLERNEAYQALKASQERLAEELSLAADYVMSILPPPMDQRGVKTQWKYIPSTNLGGDSFGYHWISEDELAIYLLDVCDHGVGPALLSVSAINVLRSGSLPEVDFAAPEQVLRALNETFQMEKNNNLYFTMWYGVYNTQSRVLRYASGGHPPALLFGGGQVQELKTPCMIIGGMPDMEYTSDEVTVAAGSALYVYSDGVYEIAPPDGDMWAFEAFVEFMGQRGHAPLDELYQHVMAMHARETLDDDFSIMRLAFA